MATARLEKPHCGNSGVPFMNRTMSFDFTIPPMRAVVSVVPPERQTAVTKALSHLITVPVSSDFTGSTIVYRKEELIGGGLPR